MYKTECNYNKMLQFKHPLQRDEMKWINAVRGKKVINQKSLKTWSCLKSWQTEQSKSTEKSFQVKRLPNVHSVSRVHKHVFTGAALQKPDVNEGLKIKPSVQVNLDPDEGDRSGDSPTEHAEDSTAGRGEDKGPVSSKVLKLATRSGYSITILPPLKNTPKLFPYATSPKADGCCYCMTFWWHNVIFQEMTATHFEVWLT